MNLKRPYRIAILISGRGSNMDAILRACQSRWSHVEPVVVGSSNHLAKGLVVAQGLGVPTFSIDPKDFVDRQAYDLALIQALDRFQPDLVILAGYMRILSELFVHHYADRLVNIHPSLLPMFPGLYTHRQALEMGVKIHGCTVHFVTPTLDCGPIIAQAWVPVLIDDTPESLSERVLVCEHPLYVQSLDWIVNGLVSCIGNQVHVRGVTQRLFSLDELNKF